MAARTIDGKAVAAAVRERVKVDVAAYREEAGRTPTLATILVGEPGGVNILTTEIYLGLRKKFPPSIGEASAFSVVLIVLTVILIYLYSRVTRDAARYQTVTGKGFRTQPIRLRWSRFVLLAIGILYLALTVVVPFERVACNNEAE